MTERPCVIDDPNAISVTVTVRYADGAEHRWIGVDPILTDETQAGAHGKGFLEVNAVGWRDEQIPARPVPPCPICQHDNFDHEEISVDQWRRHSEWESRQAEEYGADDYAAASYAENAMRNGYGPCPAGPIRPFGPWLNFVPPSYDLNWHDETDVRLYGPAVAPDVSVAREWIAVAAAAGYHLPAAETS